MFHKKKSLPILEQSNGGSSPAEGSLGRVPSESTSPRYLYGIPTLRPPNSTDFQSNPNPSHTPRHGRSVSHPFPSLLANVKREGNRSERGVPGTQAQGGMKSGLFSSSLPKQVAKGPPHPQEHDFVSGRCATCDSTVRWPRQLDVFRCTVCLMVNDLQYGPTKEGPIPPGQAGRPTALSSSRKVLPVSLERTRGLIHQCIQSYLRRLLYEGKQSSESGEPTVERARPSFSKDHGVVSTPGSSELQSKKRLNGDMFRIPTLMPGPNSSGDFASESRFASSTIQSPTTYASPVDRSVTGPGQPRTSDEGTNLQPKYVFRELETYLLSCMHDSDCLNASFAIAKPPIPLRAASEASVIHDQPKRHDLLESHDGFVTELDPKMLLMGDIGENAQFWLGERAEAAEGQRRDSGSTMDRRPPRFNWKQVWEWYHSILTCGRTWRTLRDSFDNAEKAVLEDPEVEKSIEHALAEARYHVQRTLLKATENLLRHPRRPIRRPEDARFLMILLSNPLLHPRESHHAAACFSDHNDHTGVNIERSETRTQSIDSAMSVRAYSASWSASRGGATGHHSGIIKRILGLIGNLSNETHHTMISWLNRMPEPQLKDLVELVSGFVSYRLTRNAGRARAQSMDPTNGLIPVLSGPAAGVGAQLHAAIASSASAKPSKEKDKEKPKENGYADDWQVKGAAKVMSLLFFANFGNSRLRQQLPDDSHNGVMQSQQRSHRQGQVLPISAFYNALLDDADLVADFKLWESKRNKFSFCQYPMFLSIWAKIRLMEYDARQQMQAKARTAFFDSIMTRKVVDQYLVLHVRRDCLVGDSLKEISDVVGTGEEEIKKGLKIEFKGEEGVDIGGLRKEWFLLLVREVFDPRNGLFLYDEESQYCYFNPYSFETSDQYFLIGVVLGLAIYNSTILDITLPPFLFRKLLASAPNWTGPAISAPRPQMTYTLDDLAEWRPSLARGLRQLLEHEGDVETTFCRDFVVDIERYGTVTQVPLCPAGDKRAVTNANRREFVDLYVRYILDTSVSRQFEPFKRGFFTVCSGNALALFRPEEIELLVRGSDEPLDVSSLQGVAVYENWSERPALVPVIQWFWETFARADAKDQRRLLGFITGSDRIPAMGATSLVIKVSNLGEDSRRFPIARTCFNTIGLYEYESKEQLEAKLWMAVGGSEGFGLK